jgi:hypothetical protein
MATKREKLGVLRDGLRRGERTTVADHVMSQLTDRITSCRSSRIAVIARQLNDEAKLGSGAQPETGWHIVISRREIWNSDCIRPIGFCGQLGVIVVIEIQVERSARVH